MTFSTKFKACVCGFRCLYVLEQVKAVKARMFNLADKEAEGVFLFAVFRGLYTLLVLGVPNWPLMSGALARLTCVLQPK